MITATGSTGKSLVRLTRQNGIAYLTLNRAQRHNALVPGLLEDLLACLASLSLHEPMVLAANGESFSTGGDLLGFWQHRHDIGAYADHLVGLLNTAIMALYSHRGPVVCAVQGQITGGSLGLALACDTVVLHESVTITPWYVPVGFSPDGGWRAMLPDVVGGAVAKKWLERNETHSAQQCLSEGVADLLSYGDPGNDATPIASGAATTTRLKTWDERALQKALDQEKEDFVAQVQTSTAMDGIRRFLKVR